MIRTLILDALRSGMLAGLAMIPFAAIFRGQGLRVNEYGRKTLELVVGDVAPSLHFPLTFVQHMLISWLAAIPLLWLLTRVPKRAWRLGIGSLYGLGFYVLVNSLALPLLFGDETPWSIGFETVYPSLVIHLVFGFAVAATARAGRSAARE